MKKRILCSFIALLIAGVLHAGELAAQLPLNARLAICGDSITEQKQYSKFIETYLLACAGRQDVKCFQFGCNGETASGFSFREKNVLGVFRPTVATFCYGMNDGRYVPFADAIGKEYETNMRSVLTKARELGITNIVVGTPGCVDTKYFVKPGVSPAQYNDSLAHLGEIGRSLASEYKTGFANVHKELEDAMAKAKAALGPDYDVCGRDGIHPNPNGHLLMAAAFLKGLGVDGNIGEITVDMNGPSSASEGHKVAGSKGVAEVESTKYPFCFDGDEKTSGGTRSILPFCDFNERLNRFTLKVKKLDAVKAKVTWGVESKTFTKEQLTAGINLAAEFSKTPFDAAFFDFMKAIAVKQARETIIIKGLITSFRTIEADAKADPELAAAVEIVTKKVVGSQVKLEAASRALLLPVKHKICVEAVK